MLTQSHKKTTSMNLQFLCKRVILMVICFGICLPIILNAFYLWDSKSLQLRVFAKHNILAYTALQPRWEGHGKNDTNGRNKSIQTISMKIHVTDTIPAPSDQRDIRVLCWIMTAPEFLWTKAVHVRNTWGRNCTVLLFASDYKDNNFTTINITVPHGRDYLPMKTAKTFRYIYNNHMSDSEWFFKADDDTYTYMDNLRRLLKPYDTNKPIYFGYQWMKYAKQGYPSGGAGYILSKEAMRRFGRRGTECSFANGDEDVKMGVCMEKVGVKAVSSHLLNPYGLRHTNQHINPKTITLHYVKPKQMYELHNKGSPP